MGGQVERQAVAAAWQDARMSAEIMRLKVFPAPLAQGEYPARHWRAQTGSRLAVSNVGGLAHPASSRTITILT